MADDDWVPPHVRKLEQELKEDEPSKDDGDDTPEVKSLLHALRTYSSSPGIFAVAVGPTTMISMVNLSRSMEHHISVNAMHFAAGTLASVKQDYRNLTTDVARFEWIAARARGTDSFNRKFEATSFLRVAVAAFNGVSGGTTIPYEACKDGESYPEKWESRSTQLAPSVRGYLCIGSEFERGTDALRVDAWRLEEWMDALHEHASAFHPALSIYKFVAIDCRKSHAAVGDKRSRDDGAPPVVSEHESRIRIV